MIVDRLDKLKIVLDTEPRSWLITGVAGFIGSNLLEILLKLNQKVIGLDNFSTGTAMNLADVKSQVSAKQWGDFTLIEGDIRNVKDCQRALNGVKHVLHQAALGSIPRSYADPLLSSEVNVMGFINLLITCRESGVETFVYASSSSVYGDHPDLPKRESVIGAPLSPYAISKLTNELYANVFSSVSDMTMMGLRYFNVFGPRQSVNSEYAAVIPTWINAMLKGDRLVINGDGETSRDFCFIENVVQANLLASIETKHGLNDVCNIALSSSLSLNQLYFELLDAIGRARLKYDYSPIYKPFRCGDVRHSLADITKARSLFGYEPVVETRLGLEITLNWYLHKMNAKVS